MPTASRIRTSLALAGATFAFALASLPAAEARSPRGGPHYQDHRPGAPNQGGNAIPGGPRIQCIVFCGNSFTPRGPNPAAHYQDHRPRMVIVDNNGNRTGAILPGQTRSDLGWNGNHPRGSGYQNPYMPGTNSSGGRPIVQPGGPRSPGGGVFPAPPVPSNHVQDHRGDRGGIPIVGQPRPGRPRGTTPVIDPGIGNGQAPSHGPAHGSNGPLRTPIFMNAATSESCTYEWRRINGQRRQVKVCAAD